MKLQKLIIENIASIEKACIDFEHGPLGEDSIFLICGPTGAGKSTLLDAVCLALYNTTPRLKQAANERYLDENDSFSGTGEVSIDDSRMLMRRDSVSAQVELWFTDAAGDALRAVWSVAPESASGNGTYNTETLYTSCSCNVGISDFTDFKTCTVKLQRSNESGLCGNGKGERS